MARETLCFLSDHSTRISETRVPCSSTAWRVCMASWQIWGNWGICWLYCKYGWFVL